MKDEFKELRLRQMDEQFSAWRPLFAADRPAGGWVKAVRETLGMTAAQLGVRLGMTRQGVVDLERREREGAVTLGALQAAAEALDATVVYALVPRTSLAEMRRHRAEERAMRQVRGVAHTMRLESQEVPASESARQIAQVREEWLRGWSPRLWDEEAASPRPE